MGPAENALLSALGANPQAMAFGDVVMDMVKAAPKLAQHLEIDPGATVVRTEQINVDVNGVAIDFCIRHAVAEAFRYRTRIGRW